MADQQPDPPCADVDRPSELCDKESIEKPKKPRTAAQIAAFERCREARLKKKVEVPTPPPPEPEPEPKPAPAPEKKKRGPYRKKDQKYICGTCEELFENRFDLTNHKRRGKCPTLVVEEKPHRPQYVFNVV